MLEVPRVVRLSCVAAMVGLLFIAPTGVSAGEPWTRHTIDNRSRGADGVRLADVNGDGLPDITTGWEEGGVIRVYVNPGPQKAKHAWPAVTVGAVKSPEDAVLVDLDGDGALDVVSSCEGKTRTVFVHWAPAEAERYLDESAWKTEAVPATAGKTAWMFALPMQLDGRRGVDLVVASKAPEATIGWLESPENPRDVAAWKFHPLYEAGWVMSLQARDMDGDGDHDVLATDRKGGHRGVLWLENPAAAANAKGQAWKEHRVGGDDRQVMFLTAADLDGDQRSDIVTAVSGGPITWFQASGDSNAPWRLREIAMPENCGTGKGVAVGDLDGDGRQDIVFSCENAKGELSGVRLLRYADSPYDAKWQDTEISGPTGVKYDRLELLDLDADGDLDVICCEERENLGVFWYENPLGNGGK
ncbi:MAG: VCBS repeat-containing protein [Pirellulaceae bacterium]